jgi:hypothetical protein
MLTMETGNLGTLSALPLSYIPSPALLLFKMKIALASSKGAVSPLKDMHCPGTSETYCKGR